MDQDDFSEFDQEAETEAFYGLALWAPIEDIEEVLGLSEQVESCESCSYFDNLEICLKCKHFKNCTISTCASCN